MNVKPLADRILVRRIQEKEARKKSGIVLPDIAKGKPLEAEVIAVGPGKIGEDGKRVPIDIEQGDRILTGKYSGTEVKIEGQEYLIMREEDILAVLSE